MANKATKVILEALIEGALTDLLPQTVSDNGYVDGTTTLTAKLAAILADVATRAKSDDVTTEISTAIEGLRTELMGEGVPEAYDTFKEIADYIAAHKEVSDALTAAVGNKADKTTVEAIQTTLNSLGALAKKSTVSENDLDSALKTKISNAASGSHTHANKSVLDGITAAKVSAWDGKGRVIASKTQPADLTAADLWCKIVD